MATNLVCIGCAQDFENEDGDHAIFEDELELDAESDEFELELDADSEDNGDSEGDDFEADDDFDGDGGWDEDGDAPELPVDEFAAPLEGLGALGDLACATSGNTDVEYQYGCDLLGGESCYFLTPNTDYQTDYTSSEVCQPYQTLKTSTWGMNSTVNMTHWAVWYGAAPSNQSTCTRSHVEVAAYEFDQAGGGWSVVGQVDRRGTWNGSSCTFGWVTIPNSATCNANGQCQYAHAVTARAYTSNPFWFPTPNRVYLGTYRN